LLIKIDNEINSNLWKDRRWNHSLLNNIKPSQNEKEKNEFLNSVEKTLVVESIQNSFSSFKY